MPKVKYLGSEPTEWQGRQFTPGKAVSIDDEGLIAKAKGNRFFEVTGAGKSDPQPDPNEDQAEPEEIARIDLMEGDASDPSFVGSGGISPDDRQPSSAGDDVPANTVIGGYEIKHRGRGKYDVLQGEDVVQSGLSRPDAEDWVRARSA